MEEEKRPKNIFCKDYSKINEFERIGYKYVKVYEDNDYMVWDMSKESVSTLKIEVWKKRWKKQPDGSLYCAAPSDEDFGRYGWFLTGTKAVVKQQLESKFKIALF